MSNQAYEIYVSELETQEVKLEEICNRLNQAVIDCKINPETRDDEINFAIEDYITACDIATGKYQASVNESWVKTLAEADAIIASKTRAI